MVTVAVRRSGERWVCEVAVDQGGETTTHTVTVTAGDVARWGRGDGATAVEDLVVRSFHFLLEREPPDAIMRTFELSVIPRFFPEYDEQFAR